MRVTLAFYLRIWLCGEVQSLGLLGDALVARLVLVGGEDAPVAAQDHHHAIDFLCIGGIEPILQVFPAHGVKLQSLLARASPEIQGVLDHVTGNSALGASFTRVLGVRYAGNAGNAKVAVDVCDERAGRSGDGEVSVCHVTNEHSIFAFLLRVTILKLHLRHASDKECHAPIRGD